VQQLLPRTPLPPRRPGERLAFAGLLALGVTFYIVCLKVAQVDFGKLWDGLPRLARWAARAWPPDLSELVTPSSALRFPARGLLNALRGIDSFIFALILVAAVGLGPFAGVLGLALHAAGSIAKLWSESIETAEPGPIEAVTMSGAGRLKVIRYALIPDLLPNLASITLYMWEWSIRASTVLGVVGAGGIGQELKNSVDLLAFDRVFTILILILMMVTVIDTVSAWLRRRLL
jgi:phosphonate transport system permease protein